MNNAMNTAFNMVKKMNWKGMASLYRRNHSQGQKQDDLADFYYQQGEIPKDYPSDSEIMEKLPAEFGEENLNTIEFMLSKLPEKLDDQWFERELYEKERALDITTSKLSQKVMQNYGSFVEAMTLFHDLAIDLQTSASICKDSRRNLHETKENLINKVVQILVKYRKRQRYKEIVEHLMAIKRVKVLESLLNQTLDEGDYPKAIQLHLEYTTSFKELKHFTAVHQLGTNKTDSAELVKAKLVSALTQIISKFNSTNYERILVAYRLIGYQYHDVFNEIQRLFFETINKNTLNIVTLHVVMSDPEKNNQKLETFKKMRYNELCLLVKEDHFRPCLLSTFDFLCDVMSTHYQMTQWHENYDTANETAENKDFINKIKEALAKMKKTIWDDFQRRVSTLLSAVKITSFKIDDFLKILDAVYQFVDIGEAFSDSDAFNLRGSMKQTSKTYFDGLHKSRLEDLLTMLENEMWQKCPVTKDFNIMHIKEFKVFSTSTSTVAFSGRDSKKATLLESIKDGSPFRKGAEKNKEEPTQPVQSSPISSSLDDDDDDMIADELSASRVEEYKDVKKSPAASQVETPLLTTTTINVVRFITKYLQMMQILQPISYEIFQGVCELLEYYIYSIYNLFGRTDEENANLSVKLRGSLQRMHKHFIPPPPTPGEPHSHELYCPVKLPGLSPMINLNDQTNLNGLGFRTIAIESITFLEEAMGAIKPFLQGLLPKAREKNVADFYSQTIEIIPELCRFMYKSMISRWLNWEEYLNTIANTKWDLKEIGIEYTPYVDNLLKEMTNINKRLTKETRPLPKRTKTLITEISVIYLMEMLVEGYSRARRCTNEGRVQMSLDLKNIQTGLEKITNLRPVPHTHHVENYIKAYYLGEVDILPWCKEHQEYSLKQWMSIINVGVGANMKKQTKQELVTALENLDKMRKRIK